jgi:predicted O-methyltransferase YrrM
LDTNGERQKERDPNGLLRRIRMKAENSMKRIKKPEMFDCENIEDFDTKIIEEIRDKIAGINEMSYTEQSFLNGLIRKVNPQRILELGVAAGGSSCIILNAIKDFNSKLYSLDYIPYYYRDSSKKAWFLVSDLFPASFFSNCGRSKACLFCINLKKTGV